MKLISVLSGRSLIFWFWLLSRSPQESPQKYLYIEMELCSSNNLRSWILKKNRNQSQESKEESLSIFRQIVSGVEYFHSKNLVHRDLKVRWAPSKPMWGGTSPDVASFLPTAARKHHVQPNERGEDRRLWPGHCWNFWGQNRGKRNPLVHGPRTSKPLENDKLKCFFKLLRPYIFFLILSVLCFWLLAERQSVRPKSGYISFGLDLFRAHLEVVHWKKERGYLIKDPSVWTYYFTYTDF